MTRKDVIIIAVLANMGVLAILFMLAFRNDSEKAAEPEINYTIVEATPAQSDETDIIVSKAEPTDEVDTVLEDLTPIQTVRKSSNDDDFIQLVDNEPSQPVSKPEQTPPSEASNSSDDRYVEVTIKRGDALEKIARANGTTVEAIKKTNNLKTDRLKIGQVLRVPTGTKKRVADSAKTPNSGTSAAAARQVAVAEEYYTIKAGDNPWKIAKQYHMKVDELLKLNNLDEDKARNLKVGDQIRVQ